jgi:hypothetical protein
VKPAIKFRAMTPLDYEEFTRATSYHPGPQFGGVVAWCWDGQKAVVMGAVGLDGWTPTSVMAHWWIRHPRCILPLWREVTIYLAQHGRKKVIGSTPGDNVRALRMIFNKLGFVEVARIKDGWDEGIDIVISEYRINAQQQLAA